MPPSKDPVLLF
jgi:hypothetical protein